MDPKQRICSIRCLAWADGGRRSAAGGDLCDGREGCVRETQERFPAPLKSNIFRTFTSSENKGNGKKRFFRPVAPPVFGGKAHGNRLGRRWKAKRRRGHPVNEKAAIADGHGPFCGGCFFCGAAWAILLRKNCFSPGFVRFLPKFKKVLASYTDVRCMILSRKKRPDTEGMLAGAAPMTFHVEKRTFRADGPARRGKYATLDP